ncbi:MAG: hypothetical protein LBK56_07590 [Gracilibacteraceae bacterium]|jgi:hypothetical protein|nr:hypothetical protein [Gracilibacteraceae bacterium]
MEEQIKAYRGFLLAELDALAALPSGRRDLRARRLARYHRGKIADFQHERLIHLLVTLFFAFLLLALFAMLLLSGALPEVLSGAGQIVLLFALALIIFIVEIFYIKHYFFLENSIQALYLLENRLYECLHSGAEDVQ